MENQPPTLRFNAAVHVIANEGGVRTILHAHTHNRKSIMNFRRFSRIFEGIFGM